MSRLPIILSSVTLDCPVTCHHGYMSHATPMPHVTRYTLISLEEVCS